MNRFDRRIRLLAVGLSALAGYVDALGFLKLGGFFVSFMSGNSTRLGVGLAEWSSNGGVAGGLVAAFVLGVFLGSLAGGAAGAYRRGAVAAPGERFFLATAAALDLARLGALSTETMALAMGAENAVFEENGEVRIGLTYMTGTLVKVGQRLAASAVGGDRLAWTPLPHALGGTRTGSYAGAMVYPYLGLTALWIAAARLHFWRPPRR